MCDLVAKLLLQNFKQFNGTHGYESRIHPGKTVKKTNGNVRVSPIDNELCSNRTYAGTIEIAMNADINGSNCLGVKDISMFASILTFGIIEGFLPDYMHAVCLGVIRQITELLLNSRPRCHEKVFDQERDIAELDRLLYMQCPPNEITHCPRCFCKADIGKHLNGKHFAYCTLLRFSRIYYPIPTCVSRCFWVQDFICSRVAS